PDLLDREAVGDQAVRVDRDLDLALAVADERDGADVLDRLQPALDPLVGQLGDLARGAAARDHQRHDRRRIHVELLDHRRLGARRELGDDRGHLLPDVVGGGLDVPVEDEGDEDLGAALDRGGAQLVEAADGVDDLLDPLRDLALDLLGAGAGQPGGDRDGRDVDLGKEVEAEIAVRGDPQHHQRHDQHRREDRPPYAQIYEGHGSYGLAGVAGGDVTVTDAPS